MANGNGTREFKSVREHMSAIYAHLQVNDEARKLLTMKYQEKSWIGIGESPEPSNLVPKALVRISGDASQYHMFMRMLKDIKGMDIVVNKIEGTVL